MARVLKIIGAALLWCVIAIPTLAQESDKDFLTRSLQDALSGAGRTVSIDGFKGALSSSASFDRMTIADAQGIWLTLTDVRLVWTRSALLRGRLEVDQLSAARLDIPRLPKTEETAELPAAEATPFTLPDLPVSIQIADFSVTQINLGAPVLGEKAQLSIKANAQLNDDLGAVDFAAKRTDGKEGAFAIKASLTRADNVLDLLLSLTEQEQGIAARLLNLPGQPSVQMNVSGKGPVGDFATDVRLATDGQDRLAGKITLATQPARNADATPDRRVQADIGGDITTLLAPEYRAFFGPDVQLKADALLQSDGAVEVSDFTLSAQAAALQGKVTLNQDRWPTLIDVKGRITNPDGTPTLLPVGGAGTHVQSVDLRVDYNAAAGEVFDADFDITALSTPEIKIARSTLNFDGILQGNLGSVGQFLGDTTFSATGLELLHAATAEALGSQVTGRANINYIEGQPLRISGLRLAGADYGLSGRIIINDVASGLLTRLDAALLAQDLSRFSALAGREMDGQADLSLKGTLTPLSGAFDLAIAGSTRDLRLGIAQADAVLKGRTQLSLQAMRDETGTFLHDVALENAVLSLVGEAELRSGQSDVEARFNLSDVALVAPGYRGPVSVDATATQDAQGWHVDAKTSGPYGAALTAKGLATGPDTALSFTADVPEIAPFVPDLNGPVRASGTLRNSPKGYLLDASGTGPYASTAQVNGQITPQLDLLFDVAIPNLRPLVSSVSGPLAAQGRVQQRDEGFVIDATASGPYASRGQVRGLATGPNAALEYQLHLPNVAAIIDKVNGALNVQGTARKEGTAWRISTMMDGLSGTKTNVAGLVNGDGTLNLTLVGSAPMGLAHPFIAPRDLQGIAQYDLAVNGPAALSSLSGTIRTTGASMSAPNLRFSLTDIAGNVQLGGNRAALDVTANSSNGGQIELGGGVTLTPALPADISVALREIVVMDPRLYKTAITGALRVAGPLTGGARIEGQIEIGETAINVPSTGLSSIGDIPPITHIGAPAGVTSTIRKAGLDDQPTVDAAADSTGPGFGLNIRVDAPRRIFVRGRGLDAELGGSVALSGTTNRVISAGRFDLIRGRLDILGRRFTLEEGAIQFQGDLLPHLRFVSVTKTAAGEVRVIVDGPADEPEVTFESTPEAPQDEVLAQLLFGRNIAEISPFQALQLASAVATLAGRGGGGIISKVRQGFGLDDLDVTTTEDGATALRLGKYLTDKVYTDVTASSDGTADVSLNIDLTPNLKGRTTLGSDGDSSIGVFFEKDY